MKPWKNLPSFYEPFPGHMHVKNIKVALITVLTVHTHYKASPRVRASCQKRKESVCCWCSQSRRWICKFIPAFQEVSGIIISHSSHDFAEFLQNEWCWTVFTVEIIWKEKRMNCKFCKDVSRRIRETSSLLKPSESEVFKPCWGLSLKRVVDPLLIALYHIR